MGEAAIALEGLTKRYGRHRGIEDVNLRIETGEFFGFIGPNGAGKSTTIRLLLGLMRPSRGTARIFGQAVTIGGKGAKPDIGYLPSEVHLYREMRVGALVRYSSRFYPGRDLWNIDELAARLDVDLAQRVDGLSLGNRKKVGILLAVVHRPRLLILDEPTSGLDPLMQSRFFDLLHELRANGATIFFSSHVLSEVQRLCDRVAILKEGRVVAIEGVAALRSRAVKRISLEWRRAEDAWLPEDAKDVQRNGHSVHFLYQGDLKSLLEQLALRGGGIEDLAIEQPTLEEIFMHYYGRGNA